MTNELSVIDVQKALRASAEYGHDITSQPNAVLLGGRAYPASFRSLDINPDRNFWFTSSNVPHENASVQHFHVSSSGEKYNPKVDTVWGMSTVPHLEYDEGEYKFSRFSNAPYVGTRTFKVEDDPFQWEKDTVRFGPSGELDSPHLDKEGNSVEDVHNWIKIRNTQPSLGYVSVFSNGKSNVRKMRQDEFQIHKQMASPGRGLTAGVYMPERSVPQGLIRVRHHDETGKDIANYSYNPLTEELIKI